MNVEQQQTKQFENADKRSGLWFTHHSSKVIHLHYTQQIVDWELLWGTELNNVTDIQLWLLAIPRLYG